MKRRLGESSRPAEPTHALPAGRESAQGLAPELLLASITLRAVARGTCVLLHAGMFAIRRRGLKMCFAGRLQIFQGDRMTAALLDQLTHRRTIFEMNGES